MKLLKLLGALLLLFSCKGSKDFYGTYESGTYSLELKKDYSFVYRENKGLLNRVSNGVWEDATNGKVVLKSGIDINQIPILVSHEQDLSLSKGVIQFTIENQEKLDKDCVKEINLILNDDIVIPLKEFGTHTLLIEYNVKTIKIELLLDDVVLVGSNEKLTSASYIISEPNQNKISILTSFTNSLFNYITIKSDTIVIKKNKAVWLNNDNKIFVK